MNPVDIINELEVTTSVDSGEQSGGGDIVLGAAGVSQGTAVGRVGRGPVISDLPERIRDTDFATEDDVSVEGTGAGGWETADGGE